LDAAGGSVTFSVVFLWCPQTRGLTMFKEGFRTTYNPTENAMLPPAASNPWPLGLSSEGGIPPVFLEGTSKAVNTVVE
jgi:hypothetical protein